MKLLKYNTLIKMIQFEISLLRTLKVIPEKNILKLSENKQCSKLKW